VLRSYQVTMTMKMIMKKMMMMSDDRWVKRCVLEFLCLIHFALYWFLLLIVVC
jgi:hypothetical protein